MEWFDKLPAKVLDKCYLRLERLRELGHQLRRPEADFLRDGIYGRDGCSGLARVGERERGPVEGDRSRCRAKEEASPAKQTYEEV